MQFSDVPNRKTQSFESVALRRYARLLDSAPDGRSDLIVEQDSLQICSHPLLTFHQMLLPPAGLTASIPGYDGSLNKFLAV